MPDQGKGVVWLQVMLVLLSALTAILGTVGVMLYTSVEKRVTKLEDAQQATAFKWGQMESDVRHASDGVREMHEALTKGKRDE